MPNEFIQDRFAGVSLGLQHRFRLIKLKGNFSVIDLNDRRIIQQLNGDYAIFDYLTGQVQEYPLRQESDFYAEQFAMNRLFEINSASQELDNETLEAIDSTP